MNRLVWLGCISYLVIGMAHVAVGSVLEQAVGFYGLNYEQGGQWIMNQFLGFLAGVLAAPYLTRYLGKRGALLLALVMLACTEALYGMLLPWEWMLAAAPLAGFGFGLTETVIASTVIESVENKTLAFAKMEAFFGIGALVMPFLASLLISLHAWRWSFPMLALLAGTAALLWWKMSFGEVDRQIARAQRFPSKDSNNETPVRPRYHKKDLWVLVSGIAFFMIYVGMEMSLSNYLPAIMIGKTGMNSAFAASTISVFWGFMVVGRMLAGRVADLGGYSRYLLVSIAGGALLLWIIVNCNAIGASLVFIGLDGLMWSGVFSVMLLYLDRFLPGMTERTTSLMVAFGGIGGAIFPKITGGIMDRFNATSALWMLAAMAACQLLLLIGLILCSRRQALRSAPISG